ncbi:somatomedin-B and thrombospondin type-1 domain-containing protein-like [Wyeomyia smithii]|uniref:somatomedin-B and thrombospondin type-1 domain-containing protein-like n=1 Tax=Wyeomyia smithii TaxID=174621 RepID=UPI002467FCE4|nr:somatomedin-B and thrombospondin type-1 domain-containing protein-like [Wyeomyia smithii]XP_055535330.1 somatomedin-B and thrombospondin type-1 domain-containing protein-like [Wyeomyia smithii]XP_055535331.1 somatomedin-B and thrombospondin type-1 domain-containing protein-like [Wyeomyia smithii]
MCTTLMLLQLVALFVAGAYGGSGSCRDAALCCSGRDSACVVQKVPPNAMMADLNVKPCYCDHACLKLDDCCGDFKGYCGVIDCAVSVWGPWRECDALCGSGTSTRIRTIRQPSHNGGKHCPSLVQKRGCQGGNCRMADMLRLLGETARLLPVETSQQLNRAESGTTKTTHRDEHELRNPHAVSSKYETNSHCISFEVMKASKHCQRDPDFRLLSEGDRVVVRCGLSLFSVDDASSSVYDYLFNNSISKGHIGNDSYKNDVSDGDIYDTSAEYDSSTNSTTRAIQHTVLYRRCLGEGLTGRNTRFSALTVPACHGKWLRLTVGLPKKCSPNEARFIFV